MTTASLKNTANANMMEMTTLSHLNKPQKRALILRDQLRFKELQHLDGFLDGISSPEPPHYIKINGKIHPPLTEVTLKESATRYDLGNVIFPDEGNAVYRAYLTVEGDCFEMRTEKPLPRDDADLDSVPIHCFIARGILPLFKEKIETIFARKRAINEARRLAYKMSNVPAARFQEGETLARLDARKTTESCDSSQSKKLNKRKPGEAIVKHPMNKRKRIGLEVIPDHVKSETFNTIPDQIKVGLFDTMMKTAFPNFDNLMMASCNVISVYSNVGSEFPELHRAIVDLKAVLDEFEAAWVTERMNRGGDEKLKMRRDFATAQHTGAKLLPKPVVGRGIIEPATCTSPSPLSQPQTCMDVHSPRLDNGKDTASEQLSPPQIPQLSQHPHRDEIPSNGDGANEREEPNPVESRLAVKLCRKRDTSHVPINARKLPSVPGSTHSSPPPQPIQLPHERAKIPRSQEQESDEIGITPELSRKRHEYHSSISKTNRNSAGVAKAKHSSAEESDDDDGKQRDADGDGGFVPFLGDSMLGSRKPSGTAPLAPMLHTKKGCNDAAGK